MVISEFPEIGEYLENPLSEKGIKIPSRPNTGVERPCNIHY